MYFAVFCFGFVLATVVCKKAVEAWGAVVGVVGPGNGVAGGDDGAALKLELQRKELEDRLQRCGDELDAERAKVREMEAALRDKESEADDLRSALDAYRQMLRDRACDSCDEVRGENVKLREALQQKLEAPADPTELEELRRRLDEEVARNKGLQKELEAGVSSFLSAPSCDASETQQLRDEKRALVLQVERLQAETARRETAAVRQLEAENGTLQTKLQDAAAAIVSMEEKLLRCSQEARKQCRDPEHRRLQQDLATATDTVFSLELELAAAKKGRATPSERMQHELLEQELAACKADLAAVTAKAQVLEAGSKQETQQLHEENILLRQKLNEATDALVAMDGRVGRTASLEEEAAGLRRDNEQLKGEVGRLQAALQEGDASTQVVQRSVAAPSPCQSVAMLEPFTPPVSHPHPARPAPDKDGARAIHGRAAFISNVEDRVALLRAKLAGHRAERRI